MEHVVTIDPSGSITAMHSDKFSLGFLGPQTIKRASDIRWDEEQQSWGIWFAVGEEFVLPVPEYAGFETYDEARSFEVNVMNECAKMGIRAIDYNAVHWARRNR